MLIYTISTLQLFQWRGQKSEQTNKQTIKSTLQFEYNYFTLTSFVSENRSLANESNASMEVSTRLPPILQRNVKRNVLQMRECSLFVSMFQSGPPFCGKKKLSRRQHIVVTLLMSTQKTRTIITAKILERVRLVCCGEGEQTACSSPFLRRVLIVIERVGTKTATLVTLKKIETARSLRGKRGGGGCVSESDAYSEPDHQLDFFLDSNKVDSSAACKQPTGLTPVYLTKYQTDAFDKRVNHTNRSKS